MAFHLLIGAGDGHGLIDGAVCELVQLSLDVQLVQSSLGRFHLLGALIRVGDHEHLVVSVITQCVILTGGDDPCQQCGQDQYDE